MAENKNTQFINSLFLERTNLSNKNLADVLTIISKMDSLDIIIKTITAYKNSDVKRDFWNPSPEEVHNSIAYHLNVDEVRMLKQKLEEFLAVYDNWSKHHFVVGEDEDLIAQQEAREQIDVPFDPSESNSPVSQEQTSSTNPELIPFLESKDRITDPETFVKMMENFHKVWNVDFEYEIPKPYDMKFNDPKSPFELKVDN